MCVQSLLRPGRWIGPDGRGDSWDVSLVGGTGTPLGIAAGVLNLTVLRSGLNGIAAPPFAHDLATGLAMAISDASFLRHRLIALNEHVRRNFG